MLSALSRPTASIWAFGGKSDMLRSASAEAHGLSSRGTAADAAILYERADPAFKGLGLSVAPNLSEAIAAVIEAIPA